MLSPLNDDPSSSSQGSNSAIPSDPQYNSGRRYSANTHRRDHNDPVYKQHCSILQYLKFFATLATALTGCELCYTRCLSLCEQVHWCLQHTEVQNSTVFKCTSTTITTSCHGRYTCGQRYNGNNRGSNHHISLTMSMAVTCDMEHISDVVSYRNNL